jgi:hypothetical protein
MQAADAEILNGDPAFNSLDFRKIYHEGAYSQEEADIKVWRCAEVLTASPLELDGALEGVVCRSDAERKTLLHMLGPERQKWASKVKTVTQPGYFNADYAFVESVDLNSDAVAVKFHARKTAPVETWVKVKVTPLDQLIGTITFERRQRDLRKRWNFQFNPDPGRYRVRI